MKDISNLEWIYQNGYDVKNPLMLNIYKYVLLVKLELPIDPKYPINLSKNIPLLYNNYEIFKWKSIGNQFLNLKVFQMINELYP